MEPSIIVHKLCWTRTAKEWPNLEEHGDDREVWEEIDEVEEPRVEILLYIQKGLNCLYCVASHDMNKQRELHVDGEEQKK